MTNLTLHATLKAIAGAFSKGSLVLMFPEECRTSKANTERVVVGYVYKTSPLSQHICVRVASNDSQLDTRRIVGGPAVDGRIR